MNKNLPPEDWQVLAALDGQEDERAAVASLIAELDDNRLLTLAPATRLELLRALARWSPGDPHDLLWRAGELSAQERDALARLYRVLPVDGAWQRHEDLRMERLAGMLLADGDIGTAAAGWARLGGNARAECLLAAARHHAEAHHIDGVQRVLLVRAPGAPATGIDDEHLDLVVNTGHGDFADFGLVLTGVMESCQHLYQEAVTCALRLGRLRPADPRWRQAGILTLNHASGGWFEPGEPGHDDQPWMALARDQSRRLCLHVAPPGRAGGPAEPAPRP